MLKAVSLVVGKVALAAVVLFAAGCVVDGDHRHDRHGYRDRHRHYYERSDYRYGRDRHLAPAKYRYGERYRDYYGRWD